MKRQNTCSSQIGSTASSTQCHSISSWLSDTERYAYHPAHQGPLHHPIPSTTLFVVFKRRWLGPVVASIFTHHISGPVGNSGHRPLREQIIYREDRTNSYPVDRYEGHREALPVACTLG
jgi:hypothetical protein